MVETLAPSNKKNGQSLPRTTFRSLRLISWLIQSSFKQFIREVHLSVSHAPSTRTQPARGRLLALTWRERTFAGASVMLFERTSRNPRGKAERARVRSGNENGFLVQSHRVSLKTRRVNGQTPK